MIRQAIIAFSFLVAATSLFAGTRPEAATNRETMPNFELRSGDRETLTQDAVAGRIVLFFYETESTMSVNQDLKDRLESEFGRGRSGGALSGNNAPYVLPVADCSKARWPFVPFWERALLDYTSKLGYTLWGDWTGRLREDCGFAENEANFLVLDRNGRVRYRANGLVAGAEIDKVISIVGRIIAENQ